MSENFAKYTPGNSLASGSESSSPEELAHWDAMKWLAKVTPIDYSARHIDHVRKLYPGTCRWLLNSEKFDKWIQGRGQTLLCQGLPGTGKTTLAAAVTQYLDARLDTDDNVGVAYLYFDPLCRWDHDANVLLSNIVMQLTRDNSRLRGDLKDMYNSAQFGMELPKLYETLKCLHSMVGKLSQVFLVIDALDECSTSCRDVVLREVRRLQRKLGVNVMATSRPDPDLTVSAYFESVIEVEVSADEEDLRTYASRVIRRLQSVGKELQDNLVTSLVQSARGRSVKTIRVVNNAG